MTVRNSSHAVAAIALVGALSATAPFATAQVRLDQLRTPDAPSPSPPGRRAPPVSAMSTKASDRIPEGAQVRVRLDEQLSSATNVAGDEFSISTDEAMQLPDGVVIPAGFHGKGEVADAHRKEMLGKAGVLALRLDYIRIGDVRVHLRANKVGEGRSGVATTVVLSLLITPLFLMHHGADIVFPKGQTMTAYVDEDVSIPLPVPAPPPAE